MSTTTRERTSRAESSAQASTSTSAAEALPQMHWRHLGGASQESVIRGAARQ
jgi:hypothetical protein